ncbi:hypothetical protein DBR40_20005 [Pedobacter sp. KBW01]|nr:hypothetical protein DBR40_20005 [Pedobacter sp. KBW01]
MNFFKKIEMYKLYVDYGNKCVFSLRSYYQWPLILVSNFLWFFIKDWHHPKYQGIDICVTMFRYDDLPDQ